MQTEKQHRITLRLSKKAKHAIKRFANKNHRSINSEIECAINYYTSHFDNIGAQKMATSTEPQKL